MKIIAIILVMLLPLGIMAGELDVNELLKRGLGEQVSFVSASEIHYCPDNTCDIYKASKSLHLLPSYVYLHIIYSSSYIRLYRQQFIESAKESTEVMAKVRSYCKENEPSPECILEGMASEMGLINCSGRYDEGYFCHSCNGSKNVCKEL